MRVQKFLIYKLRLRQLLFLQTSNKNITGLKKKKKKYSTSLYKECQNTICKTCRTKNPVRICISMRTSRHEFPETPIQLSTETHRVRQFVNRPIIQ